MITLGTITVNADPTLLSPSVDLLSVQMTSTIAAQLSSNAVNGDSVAFYGSELSTLTTTADLVRAAPLGSIGFVPPGTAIGINPDPNHPPTPVSGQLPVQLEGPLYRYLYAVRVSGTTAPLTVTMTAQETAGTAGGGGGINSVSGTYPVNVTAGANPVVSLLPVNGGYYWQASVIDWPTVRAQITALAPTPGPIYFDTGGGYVSMGVSAEITDMHGMWFQQATADSGITILSITDGAQLYDIGGSAGDGSFGGGVRLLGARTGGLPAFDWGNGTGALLLTSNSTIGNTGTLPLVDVAPAGTFAISFLDGSGLDTIATGPVVHLGAGATCTITVRDCLPSALTGAWITGGGTTTIVVRHSGFNFAQVASWAGFTGTIKSVALDLNGGSGATAYRPSTLDGALAAGTMFFDTTLGQPIWWSIVHGYWVDATGAGPK